MRTASARHPGARHAPPFPAFDKTLSDRVCYRAADKGGGLHFQAVMNGWETARICISAADKIEVIIGAALQKQLLRDIMIYEPRLYCQL